MCSTTLKTSRRWRVLQPVLRTNHVPCGEVDPWVSLHLLVVLWSLEDPYLIETRRFPTRKSITNSRQLATKAGWSCHSSLSRCVHLVEWSNIYNQLMSISLNPTWHIALKRKGRQPSTVYEGNLKATANQMKHVKTSQQELPHEAIIPNKQTEKQKQFDNETADVPPAASRAPGYCKPRSTNCRSQVTLCCVATSRKTSGRLQKMHALTRKRCWKGKQTKAVFFRHNICFKEMLSHLEGCSCSVIFG